MENDYKSLNDFFVNCFYGILKQEENSLSKYAEGNLSISEIHLIEAISRTKDNNAATNVSRSLKITPGSLTVAANTLINKGYIIRKKDETDKRISRLYLTEKGNYINEKHLYFHNEMVKGVIEALDSQENGVLIKALNKINDFMEKT